MSARLTVAEVAEAFRRHPVTVRKALEGGALHGAQARTGGRWLIQEACAEAWIAGEKCVHRSGKVVPIRRAS